MQVLPTEVKEDYLRKADLLMRPQNAAGHPSGHAQVGHYPGGPAQVVHYPSRPWHPRRTFVGHAVGSGHCSNGQPQCDEPVGQDAVGHPSGQVESFFF